MSGLRMVLDKRFFNHRNLTPRKMVYFGVLSGIGALVVGGGTYLLTEKLGMWYILSTIISGGIAFWIKFIMSALWAFRD